MNQFHYNQLPYQDIDYLSNEIINIKQRVEEPVILKNCYHTKICLTFAEVKQSWLQRKEIQCVCGNKTNNLNDLRKDVRMQIYEQFHPSVEQVQLMHGILTHKYSRFSNLIEQTDRCVYDFLQKLKNKFLQSNSISSIFQKSQQNKIIFWALCLLDKIKIITPVRFVQCQHPECYELTSLLDKQTKSEAKFFRCAYPGCPTTINLSSLQDMLQHLILDIELLTILNKCSPSRMKFTISYWPKRKIFDLDIDIEDPIVTKLYQQLSEKERQELSLKMFTNLVQSITASIIQQDPNPIQKRKLMQEKYKTMVINMIDPLTQEFIEIPVRCSQCKLDNICMDLRSFATTHIIAKLREQQINCCLLCGNQYQCRSIQLNSNILYVDQCLITKMMDSQYIQTKQFKYDGRQVMLEEFYKSQKFPKETYIENLRAQTYSTIGEFSLQSCTCDPAKQIEIPLIISDCPQKSLIDFDSFYRKMAEMNFDIEEQGYSFCKCNYCNLHPINQFYLSIFYHEAYAEALSEFNKSKATVPSFRYDFSTKRVFIKLRKDY